MTPEEAIKELREASDSEVRYGDTNHHYDEVMKRIEAFDMAIKALEEISRLPENLHREREQAYMNGYADAKSTCKKSAYDDAVERIEKSTFTLHDGLDCVETLVALEAVMIASGQTKSCEDWKFYYNHGYAQAKRDLARPTGKWIVYDVVKFGDFVGTEKYECSKCHHRVGVFKSNFCPNCGAKMEEKIKLKLGVNVADLDATMSAM